jgi:hypothetical protein
MWALDTFEFSGNSPKLGVSIISFSRTGGEMRSQDENISWGENNRGSNWVIELTSKISFKIDWYFVIIVILRNKHCKSKRWPAIKKAFTHTPSCPTLQRLQ